MTSINGTSISINPNWEPSRTSSSDGHGGLVEAYHRSIPGFRATQLVEAESLVPLVGVEHVYVKYENERLGLPSFKVVGASWAINCAMAHRLDIEPPQTFAATTKLAARLSAGTTLTSATDGNHGRAVAHLARRLDLPARIYVPDGMTQPRIEAIRAEGADVAVVSGSYDEAVCVAAADAKADAAFLLVSDTSWPGYERIPLTVAEGYGTIFSEASRQLRAAGHSSFDVAFVPAGVGALASAAVNALQDSGCAVMTVEPADADCVRRSLAAGAPITVPGPHRSIMAGLNCGEVSHAAWPTLRRGVRASIAISDEETIAAVRMLAGMGMPSGESGAAALAGALAVAQSNLTWSTYSRREPRVALLLDSEGVTDPKRHAEIVR